MDLNWQSNIASITVYCRVNDRNQDHQGSSGTQWHEEEPSWERSSGSPELQANGATVKHKKAWDWDADW